jgi:excisionase family DNA binding protein
MPRTKKQEPTPQQEPSPAAVNGPPGDVLTLSEAAAYLRLPEAEVIGLVQSQGLPGRLIGSEWRFLKAALQQWLSTSSPTPEMRKAAQMALVGAWKDDPDIEQIVEDAMRARGRPLREDGTYSGHKRE